MSNKLILDYYLNTKDYFLADMDDFLEAFEHRGVCGESYEYHFSSKVDVRVKAKHEQEEGYRISESPDYLYKHFKEGSCESQRFAVVFGFWYGLPEKACRVIGDKRRKKLAGSILNAFLCGMTPTEVEKILLDKSLSIEAIRQLLDAPCKEYEIYTGDETIEAVREGDTLIDKTGGKRYPMSLIQP